MEPNMLKLLVSVLSGQTPASSRVQTAQPQPMQQAPRTSTMLPMRSERPDHGNSDHNDNPNGDGDGNGGGANGGGGGKGKGSNLSEFEKLLDKIGTQGPKAYTKGIQRNVGMTKPTIGYGKNEPSSFMTGMASLLGGVPSAPTTVSPPTPQPDPIPGQKRYPV